MVMISIYTMAKIDERTKRVNSGEDVPCPRCRGLLRYLALRSRGLINTAGEKECLLIRRLRCDACDAIHHELPDCIVPYKRHCAETAETIISGTEPEAAIETSTIRRISAWWRLIYLYLMSVLASLTEKYGVMFSDGCSPREMIRAAVNANLWVHTRSAFLSG